MIILTILLVLAGLLLLAVLVLNYYPAFGGKASPAKVGTLRQSPNYQAGKFANQTLTVMDSGFTTTLSILRDFMKGNPNRKPSALPVLPWAPPAHPSATEATVTWLGHSALLLQVEGKTLLLDPMLGTAPSPFPAFGGKRYSATLPVEIEQLPVIDLVLLSHDHYDHLDYDSIMKLKHKVRHFLVPLGVGSHLERWGVPAASIQELDWWEEREVAGLHLACTPARHFSGRSLTDRNATLWCSWVIAGRETKLYFSGDSGYGPHFAEIGEKYGPFDLTMMECGQYDDRWANIHMMPEETVQAHLDVRGEVMLPIHWAAFTLSVHDWNDPVKRATQAAQERNVRVATPKIGETLRVGAAEYPSSTWWK